MRNIAAAKSDLFAALAPEWNDPGLFAAIQKEIQRSGRKVVVLDDDPTGTQTVHDLNILTGWSVERLRTEFAGSDSTFYVLTNSRSVPRDQAHAMNVEIATNLARAARETGREFDIISRSDSTLRGHYPAEMDALAETLERETGTRFDGHIIIPFFAEGGRFTVNDIHWVQDGGMLVPAAQTEYARDPAFGYTSSNLREWVEEKTAGRHHAADVVSIPLDVIRRGGPDQVAQILGAVRGGAPVILNCVSYRDLEVFVAGLLRAEANGRRFLFRAAAGFVKVRGGISDQALLTAPQLYHKGRSTHGGLVVVGSYIQKSSAQLTAVQGLGDVVSVELNVTRILDPSSRATEISSAAQAIDDAIARGRTGLVFTSRAHVTGGTKDETLRIAQAVSSALVEVVQQIQVAPRFVVAKGGITSSDTATRGLGVQHARVLGQIAPGVPVWRLEDESRFPGVPYIVFPGNVGAVETLAQVVHTLRS